MASFRALILPAALAVAATAAAQTAPAPAPRIEIWGGVVATATTPSGSLTSSYSPPLANDGAFTSTGQQTLNIAAERSAGFEAGVNLFPWPHAGVQLFFDRASADVSGVNGPYDLSLQYVSRQPPDYQPRAFSLERSITWPDTTGSLTQSTVGVNAIVRGGRGRVSASASGGLSYYRMSASVQPLAYTVFRLGGHSTLFYDEYHLDVALGPANAVGFNLGGDVTFSLGRGVGVMAGYRYLGGPTVDLPARLVSILNADQVGFAETVDDIAAHLAPGPARAGVAASRLVVAIKITR